MSRDADAIVPAPLPDLTAARIVAAATWRELLRRRRLLSLGVLLLLPVLLLVAVSLWYPGEAPAGLLLALLAGEIYIPFLLPIVAMALGAPAISEPIAEGTLVYFWTRPLNRPALYLGRILAAALVACAMVLLSQAAVFATLLSADFGGVDLALVRLHAEMTVVTLLGAVGYTALFGCFGAGFKRPLVPAILFAFGWEPLVANIPQRIQEWTLRFHLRNLVHWPAEQTTDIRGFLETLLNRALSRDPVPVWHSILVLVLVIAVSTAAGVVLLRRRQLDRQG
ncbi:MAG TPA: ABC transporter permease subunit [Candidatus Krumholzibacteria bacterium]|nr:ABC transporter permease subunit [Candidatus Krumholzibacteria bacterium]HPD72152.1 ABC transporter permease subunit [Candidatus Krumholzibacteria bacterium]HRY40916.1 ABC transporter permease subunit [Candidatus Krumholzibacteria bacterium]